MRDVVVIGLLAIGTLFFVAGTIGLLRFPDLPTRLHAVAKADNLGLGFIVAALAIWALTGEPGESAGVGVAAKLGLIWVLCLVGTAANSHLLAGHHRAAARAQRDRVAPADANDGEGPISDDTRPSGGAP